MCGIIGFFPINRKLGNVSKLFTECYTILARGRDGFGLTTFATDETLTDYRKLGPIGVNDIRAALNDVCAGRPKVWGLLGNARACPTTEYKDEMHVSMLQPYTCGDWTIVHNGTIANDKELGVKTTSGIDSEVIAQLLNLNPTRIPEYSSEQTYEMDIAYLAGQQFQSVVNKLKGSFAILAINKKIPNVVYVANNYKPLYITKTEQGVFISSCESAYNDSTMLTPYRVGAIKIYADATYEWLFSQDMLQSKPPFQTKALMICSAGLDSTVAAQELINRGYQVTLMHFNYNCRATNKESEAIERIADAMDVTVVFKDMSIYSAAAGPLLNRSSSISDGESGAEFANEWVPARNLVMLSLAVAHAEEYGFDIIGLGNNLEESGAYPDNEPAFIDMFNKMLPFAVADGKRIRVVSPVGNLMKHEIVALGLQNGAPMELTWSCYSNDETHCGACGPCYMRKKAFEINGKTDPVFKETK